MKMKSVYSKQVSAILRLDKMSYSASLSKGKPTSDSCKSAFVDKSKRRT